MKKNLLLIPFLLLTISAAAQFEQKVSINISLGSFKTFGKAFGVYDPMQMPNYKPGLMAEAGLQFNLNRRLSIMTNAGLMYSGGWSYIMGENDYMHFAIYDTITEEILAEGYNKLDFLNFSFGIIPKYYLIPGKKWNPYLFAGVNINYTHANYTDNWWKTSNELDMLPPDDSGPYNPFLENNFGIGFIPGIGIEYSPGDKFGITFTTGYTLILLNEKNIKSEHMVENFNAFFLQAGIRLSFLKSKDL